MYTRDDMLAAFNAGNVRGTAECMEAEHNFPIEEDEPDFDVWIEKYEQPHSHGSGEDTPWAGA